MARPTSDKKDSKVILRINNETRERIEKSAADKGCSISDYVRGVLSGNVGAGIPDELNAKLENAGKVFHMTVDELIAEFVRMLYAGEIECEDKVLYPRMPKWVQDLDTRVRKEGIDGERVAERVMKMIEDGEI